MAQPKTNRIKSAYYKPEAGEWVQPVHTGYRLACCDCGLVHLMNFRVHKRRVQFSVFRARKHTAAIRRRPHDYVSAEMLDAVAAKLLAVTGKKTLRIGKYKIRLRKAKK